MRCTMISSIKCFLHDNLWGQQHRTFFFISPFFKFFRFKVSEQENPQIWLQRILWFSPLFNNWMLDVKAYSKNLSTKPCLFAYTITFRGGRTSMSMNFTWQWSLGDFYFLGLSIEELFFYIAGPPLVIEWKDEVTH